MFRPEIKTEEVTAFLTDWAGGGRVSDMTRIEAGQVSSVFSFISEEGVPDSDETGPCKLIVRFSSHENAGGLVKSGFIIERAAAAGVAIPRSFGIGEAELPVSNLTDEDQKHFDANRYPLTFSISEWVDGEEMEDLQNRSAAGLILQTIETIEKISSVDISGTSGWGWFGGDGVGRHASLFEHYAASVFDKSKTRLYAQHRDRFESGFLEVDTFDFFSNRLMEIVERLPEVPRVLVHTDFGWDNVLVRDGEIAAVIDWDNAIFGDELYDYARQQVYVANVDFRSMVRSRWESAGWDMTGFEARWMTCAVHAVLDTLNWYGWSDNATAYEWLKAQGLELLGEGPPVVGRHPGSG